MLNTSIRTALASLFLTLTVAASAGCKHQCQKDGGTIPDAIQKTGLLLDGAEACEFGGKTDDELMENIAYVKVYHSGNFKKNGLDYIKNAESKGWERVACEGGMGKTMMDEHRMIECFKNKDRQRVRFDFYDLDGTAVDVDLLRLKTPEEVLGGKK